MSAAAIPPGERLAALVIARLATAPDPLPAAALAAALQRFAPREQPEPAWRGAVAAALEGLVAAGAVDAAHRVRDGELERRLGAPPARWQQLAERTLPALALHVRPGDAAALKALADRDAWAAAITARAYGLWRDGRPPSLPAVCDALVWRALALAGKPARCPPALRAHFLRQLLDHPDARAGAPSAPDRLIHQLAARAVGAPRAELRALRDALVRGWLAGRELDGAAPAARAGVAAPAAEPPRSLVADALAVARAARAGVFGDRKVFISAVWEGLRAMPAWAALGLDELKEQLVAAHRRRELVLARADLVAAMDPALVAASEARTDGATFHFLVREPP